MSELKAGVIRTPHNEGISFDRDSSHIAVTEDETEFYLKSEVDKKIAKLKGKLVEQTTLRVYAELQLRHNKYKRCLIIIANIKAAMDSAFFVSGEYLDWMNKWHERWLKIAEQFKEDK